MTTPINEGIANISRLPIRVSMGGSLCGLQVLPRDAVGSLPPCGEGLGWGVAPGA